jgi:hypothetical protein
MPLPIDQTDWPVLAPRLTDFNIPDPWGSLLLLLAVVCYAWHRWRQKQPPTNYPRLPPRGPVFPE